MRLKLLSRSAAGVVALMFAWAIFATGLTLAAGKPLPAQTSREGAVTVKVTPVELSGRSAVWRFEVVFDTHVAELNHDVLAIATLSGGGKEFRAVSWEGDKPGGHHRKGVLRFDAVKPAPSSVTLTIRNVGGPERRFNWMVPAQ